MLKEIKSKLLVILISVFAVYGVYFSLTADVIKVNGEDILTTIKAIDDCNTVLEYRKDEKLLSNSMKETIILDTNLQRFVYDGISKTPILKDTNGDLVTLSGFNYTYEMYYYADFGACSDTKEPGLYKVHITRIEDEEYNAIDSYIEIVVTYSLTYKANTGCGEDVIDISDNDTIHKDYFGAYCDDEPDAYYLDAKAIIKADIFTKENYTFAFWNTKQDGTGTSYKKDELLTLKENTVLYACYSANISEQPTKDNNYTVGVSTTDNVSFLWEKEKKIITPVDLSKIILDSGIINNDEETITAVLKSNVYKVTIICKEFTKKLMFDTIGTLNDGITSKTFTYIYSPIGSKTKLYSITSDEPFTISNINLYSTEYETINSETMSSIKNVSENTSYRCIIKSIFNATSYSNFINSKTISFDGGEDVSGNIPNDMYQLENRSIILPENTLIKNGLSFIGWNDGIKTYNAGSKYLVSDLDVEFVAVWGHICNGIAFDSELDSTFTGGKLTSGHYFLTSDITLSSNIEIQVESEVLICLNGYVLNLNGYQIYSDGKKLEIYDCNDNIQNIHNYQVNEDGLWILSTETATKTLESLTSMPSKNDIISVKGGAIVNGQGNEMGGAIYSKNLKVQNITFIGNNSTDNYGLKGGAIFANEAYIINCKFYGNRSIEGSAIYGGNLNIYNSIFKYNNAYQVEVFDDGMCGGAGTIYCDGNLLVKNSIIQYNNATNGGAIFLSDENVIATIIDSTITNNTALENGAGICFGNAACFVEGTLITMADGTKKAIEDIKIGDKVKSFNHEKGIYESQKVDYVYSSVSSSDYFILNFESGTSLGIVDCHDLFNKELNKYVTITNENYSKYIDKYFYNVTLNNDNGGYDKLVSVTSSLESKKYYSIYVEYTVNCIANGFLSCPDDVDYRLNIYEFNNNLVADSNQLNDDLETFGIKLFSDCKLVESQTEYDMLGIKYYNVYIGKGLITERELNNLFYELHNYNEYTQGIDKLTLIIGKNTTINNNKVGSADNNVYLKNGSKIVVIDDATNINVGITLEEAIGTFAYNVYTNNISFTSDNKVYAIRKTLNNEKYNYSISLVKEEPSKTNDYTVVLDETIKNDYNYQWYEDLGTYKLSELDSNEYALEEYKNVSGDTIDAKFAENYQVPNSYIVAFYFYDTVSCFIYFDSNAENLVTTLACSSYIVSHEDNHYIIYSSTGEFFIYTDECNFSLENIKIQKVNKLVNETKSKFGATPLNNSMYFCNILDSEKNIIATSESIKPNKITFDGNNATAGTAPTTIYQLEGRNIKLPVNPFTKIGYKYVGWNIDNTKMTALTLTNDQYSVGNNDTIFYAIWKEKTTVSITETIQEKIYNGQSQEFTISGNVTTGFTVKYYVDDEWTTTAPINSESYKVKITRTEDDIYKAYEKEIVGGLLIKPYTVTIVKCENNFTYNGQDQSNSLTAYYYNELNAKVNLVLVQCLKDNNKFPADFIDCGEYAVLFKFNSKLEEKNYSCEMGTLTKIYTIKQKEIIIAWENKEYVYNGQELTVPTATYKDIENINVNLYVTMNESIINAGSYIATASFKNNETNYKLPTNITKEYIVNKAKVNEPMVVGTYKYTGKNQTVSLSGVESFMTTDDSLTQISAGVYIISYTLDDNYTWADNDDGIITWEIKAVEIKTELQTNDEKPQVEVQLEEGFDSTITVTVEVTVEVEVESKELTVDYYSINDDMLKLSKKEKVGVVFDVKLIQIINGEQKEIQPSDIKEGTTIKVKMLIPSTVDISKVTRILHVHSCDDIEEIEFDESKIDENGYYEIEVNRLSEFAFIYENKCVNHWFLLVLLMALLGFIAVLWFVFKIRNFKNENKLNVVPIIGFIIHVIVLIALIFMTGCTMCIILDIINAFIIVVAVILYLLYKKKNNSSMEEETFKMEDEISLKDSINSASNVVNENVKINKQTIANYLEKNFKKNVVLNKRANYISTGILPLADTHYKIIDGKKVCFTYVYELKDGKTFLLVKTNEELAKEIKKTHTSFTKSAFPKSNNNDWFSMIIDKSYSNSNEVFKILKWIFEAL